MNNFPGTILNYIKFLDENIFCYTIPLGKKVTKEGFLIFLFNSLCEIYKETTNFYSRI